MKKKPISLQFSQSMSRKLLLCHASSDLPGMARFIYQMALENDTKFFKQLGKALSRRNYTDIAADKREAFILVYYIKKPKGTNADCMCKLVDAGFPRISEANFRVLKQRLFAKVKILSKDELQHIDEQFVLRLDRNKM
jgi:hypothetical protein